MDNVFICDNLQEQEVAERYTTLNNCGLPGWVILAYENPDYTYTSYLWTYDLYDPVCNVFDVGKSKTLYIG